jgi:hypothetical protein
METRSSAETRLVIGSVRQSNQESVQKPAYHELLITDPLITDYSAICPLTLILLYRLLSQVLGELT